MTTGMIAALLATLLAGVSLLTLGLMRGRRRAVAASAAAEADTLAGPVAEELAARVEGLIAEQTRAQSDALAGLRADIQHLKSDVEWLAGERMIEQAIALAQSGVEPDDIGRELGLTREAAETITTFRKH
ncbi:MAG: hypothetical protein Q27BPR15_03720 [Rhodobacter sp. CACIA14H1]|nr:MAG: hypothetical protein Q27BPR15_03720 [Rhodobacter sp. CACIA14H1]